MNAHTPVPAGSATGRPELPTDVLAVQQKDVLRHLAAHPGAAVAEISRELERDPSNLRKTLERLGREGLYHPETRTLTQAGLDWLPRLAALEGAALQGAPPLIPWLRIRPDPNNPRTVADPEAFKRELAPLAESIARRGLLQPLLLRVDADGSGGVLNDGFRRWSAIGLLIERKDARWPVARPVPYFAAGATDEPEILADAIVANLHRQDLHPLDEATGYRKLLNLGWTPGKILDECGVERRTYEQRLDLLNLTPQQQARMRLHRDDANYLSVKGARGLLQHLRQITAGGGADGGDGVQGDIEARTLDLTPKMQLALVEVAFAVEQRPDRGLVPIAGHPTGGALATLGEQSLALFNHFGGQWHVFIPKGGRAQAWLRDSGFYDDPKAAVAKARAAVLGEAAATKLAEKKGYATGELNYTPPRASAAPKPAPPPPPADPADVTLESLQAGDQLVLWEVTHKIFAEPVRVDALASGAARVGHYWLDSRLDRLVQERKLLAFHNPGGAQGWVVYLTSAGWTLMGSARQTVTEAELEAARKRGAQAAWPGPGYVTKWLNVEAAKPAGPPAEVPPPDLLDASGDDGEAEGALEAEDAEAAALLAAVRETLNRAHTAAEIRELFGRTGLSRPFGASEDPEAVGVVCDVDGDEAATVDTLGDLHDDRARARAELVAYALNLATGPA
jgi:hypothetical protein